MNTQIIRLLLEEIEILKKENDGLMYELNNYKVDEKIPLPPVPILQPDDWSNTKGFGSIDTTKSLDCLILEYLDRKVRFSHARDFQKHALRQSGVLHSMPRISSAISQLKNKGLIVKEIEKTGSRVHWGLPDWKNKKGGIHPGTESSSNHWDIKMWDEQ